MENTWIDPRTQTPPEKKMVFFRTHHQGDFLGYFKSPNLGDDVAIVGTFYAVRHFGQIGFHVWRNNEYEVTGWCDLPEWVDIRPN